MFRVFPQDLKSGDTIVRDSTEADVLSLKNLDQTVEVNVRLPDGDLQNWTFNKSEMLDLLSSQEQRDLYETTVPDVVEADPGATVPIFRNPPQKVFDMDESDTHPFGGVKTIPKPKSKPVDS